MSADATWPPLLGDAERAPIAVLVGELVDAAHTHAPPQTMAAHADRALLRAYLAQDDVVPDPDDVASASLEAAITALAHGGAALSLFDGITGLGWCVAHVAGGDAAAELGEMIDGLLVRAATADATPYDLVSGLVGVGVYALERGEPGAALARQVLDQLERRARAHGDGLAWHTPATELPAWQRARAPDGYWNLGLAHGTPGVIALLARYISQDVERARARRVLDAAVAFVRAAAAPRPEGRFPSWIPGGEPTSMVAWCYGDLGVAFALLAAARACGVDAWEDDALALARACAARPFAAAGLRDAGLCHGAFGGMHLFHRLHRATGEPVFAEATRRWLAHGLALRNEHPIAGFPRRDPDAGGTWVADATFLTGTTGIVLALHALISDHEPAWDRRLLVDVTR